MRLRWDVEDNMELTGTALDMDDGEEDTIQDSSYNDGDLAMSYT